uniref:Uncharacterized protein n=1 Tax=Macrostomum lignano TaxID=282301 RepID=A0A1I8FV09_9PLAT
SAAKWHALKRRPTSTINSEHSDIADALATSCLLAAQEQQRTLLMQTGCSQSIDDLSCGAKDNSSGKGLKRKRRSVLASEVSNASDMP